MDFVEWMRATGLSEKSANNYLGAIKGSLTNWAIRYGLTTKQIGDITDVDELNALIEPLSRTTEFINRNATGRGMYAAALGNYQKYLQALASQYHGKPNDYGPYRKQVAQIEADAGTPYDPTNQKDARDRVLREVVQRRGQSKFRTALINAYGGRCAITGCPVVPLLEAAHITPYLGPDTNAVTNGLLLRADIHTLWDLGLMAVDPNTGEVWVSPQVDDPTYRVLNGQPLKHPMHPAQQPSPSALQQQWDAKRDEAALGVA
jgi:HNH endonuclease